MIIIRRIPKDPVLGQADNPMQLYPPCPGSGLTLPFGNHVLQQISNYAEEAVRYSSVVKLRNWYLLFRMLSGVSQR